MVLLQAVSAGALIPTQSQPQLQTILVWCIVIEVGAVSVVVLGVIAYFAWKRPAYLFSPSDIDPAAHRSLYGSVQETETEVETDHLHPGPYEDIQFIVDEQEE